MSINIFELELNDGQKVPLKWGTYAMKLACIELKTDLDGFFQVLNEITKGCSSQRMFDVMEVFLACGYEYANDKKATTAQVCEWVDASGGLRNINNGKLGMYVEYVLNLTINGYSPLPGEIEGEKKNLTEP